MRLSARITALERSDRLPAVVVVKERNETEGQARARFEAIAGSQVDRETLFVVTGVSRRETCA